LLTVAELFLALLSMVELDVVQRSSFLIAETSALIRRSFPVDELSALPRASLSDGELLPSAPPAQLSLSASELPHTSLSADELDDLPRIPLSADELDGLPREIEP
jgi:hypothetical protein